MTSKKVFRPRTWGVLVTEHTWERCFFFEYDLGMKWVQGRSYPIRDAVRS